MSISAFARARERDVWFGLVWWRDWCQFRDRVGQVATPLDHPRVVSYALENLT